MALLLECGYRKVIDFMSKSEATKQKLFTTAMTLFAKEGFEKTTMRAIAAKANVAPGASYYYFKSKESLIQEYYQKSHLDHEVLLERFWDKDFQFESRLHTVVTSKIKLAEPHKDMARALYRVAANPESSLSPFSVESKELRLKSLKLFEDVVSGSRDKFHPEIENLLPKYLWFYQMGIILYWIYDTSKKSHKTFELIDKTIPLIVWMNNTLNSTWAAPFRKKIISTLKSFEPNLN
jgi:AcrR family transcriptional regulator